MADSIVPVEYADFQDFCEIGTLEELFGALDRSSLLMDELLAAIRSRMPLDPLEELISLREDILNWDCGHPMT